jgi:hypothetical protein
MRLFYHHGWRHLLGFGAVTPIENKLRRIRETGGQPVRVGLKLAKKPVAHGSILQAGFAQAQEKS